MFRKRRKIKKIIGWEIKEIGLERVINKKDFKLEIISM